MQHNEDDSARKPPKTLEPLVDSRNGPHNFISPENKLITPFSLEKNKTY